MVNIGSNEEITGEILDGERVMASGTDWLIENVGIREGTGQAIHAQVDDPDGVGVIRGCFTANPGALNIYVDPQHQGHIIIENCKITRAEDNGIYADAPTRSGEGGGTMEVRNCKLVDNNISHVRVGADALVENIVAYNTGNVPALPDGTVSSRGLHTFYQQKGSNPTVTARNVQVDVGWAIALNSNSGDGTGGPITWDIQSGNVVGEISEKGGTEARLADSVGRDSARLDMLDGYVPETPEDAANGNFELADPPQAPSDGGGGGGGDSTTDPLVVEIIADEGETIEYSFTAGGEIVPTTTADGVSAVDEGNVSVGETSGGWEASGVTGNGFGDAFEVYGSIESWSADNPGYGLYVDGSEVSPDEVTEIEYGGGGGGGGDGGGGVGEAGVNPLYVVGGLGAAYLGYKAFIDDSGTPQ